MNGFKKELALKTIRITKTCQNLPKGLSMEKEKVCMYRLCIGAMEERTEWYIILSLGENKSDKKEKFKRHWRVCPTVASPVDSWRCSFSWEGWGEEAEGEQILSLLFSILCPPELCHTSSLQQVPSVTGEKKNQRWHWTWLSILFTSFTLCLSGRMTHSFPFCVY